tara:strand:+ start:996 stop:1514 length:519 start_codon:yes stop_codon:yes gene_type:complete
METDTETNNMKPEQIEEIAELLGQKANSSYCTMNEFGKALVAMLYALFGRTFNGKTINYQCVVHALEEMPSTCFDTLKTLIQGDLSKQKALIKSKDDVRMLESQKAKMATSAANNNAMLALSKQRALMFEHLYMHKDQNYPISEVVRCQMQLEDSITEELRDIPEWVSRGKY